MSDETDTRLDRMEDRLRQVLALLSVAPVDYTTISDSQGSFQGHDSFIGAGLRDEADKLLERWDEEDTAPLNPTHDRRRSAGGAADPSR